MLVIERVWMLFVLFVCNVVSMFPPVGTAVQSLSFREGILIPVAGKEWSSIRTVPLSKLKCMKRTIAGRGKGGFFFLVASFHAFTKLTIRALAIASKGNVSGGSMPPVAINTNLSGSAAILLTLSAANFSRVVRR